MKRTANDEIIDERPQTRQCTITLNHPINYNDQILQFMSERLGVIHYYTRLSKSDTYHQFLMVKMNIQLLIDKNNYTTCLLNNISTYAENILDENEQHIKLNNNLEEVCMNYHNNIKTNNNCMICYKYKTNTKYECCNQEICSIYVFKINHSNSKLCPFCHK